MSCTSVGCVECRSVIERGIPLHRHGSHLVIEEQLENRLGRDIGTLDGEPLIAEDYGFGSHFTSDAAHWPTRATTGS